jgi:hypothetical protein
MTGDSRREIVQQHGQRHAEAQIRWCGCAVAGPRATAP